LEMGLQKYMYFWTCANLFEKKYFYKFFYMKNMYNFDHEITKISCL